MTTVQLRANHNRYGEVEPAANPDEVQFFSVYLGNPGAFKWMADFECADEAISYTNELARRHDATIDRAQFAAVLNQPRKERTMTTPHPHPHAHLMALYAQDAAKTDKPWERWEYRLNDFQPWVPLNHSPNWSLSCGYRRKPKTIKVNGFDVPAPVRTALNGPVWLAAPHAHSYSVKFLIVKTDWETLMLQRGLFHATEEAAVAHAKAMLGIDPEELT